ncbi:MAG: RNA polymerase sigma factor [Terriglobia bacterium]
MPPEPTSEELLMRAAARDEGAFSELYDRAAPGVLGLLLRILPNRVMAEEVLQDVFLRVWSDARRWNKENVSVAAGITLLARAKAVDRLRIERNLTARANGKADALLKFYFWLPRPTEIQLLDGRRDLFRKVINQLPKPQRQALELAVFDGLTETEIAQKLGEPLAKVRSGLLAAVRFIRHRLAAVMRTWAANI